jgi:iron complex outermembrane recepter protein
MFVLRSGLLLASSVFALAAHAQDIPQQPQAGTPAGPTGAAGTPQGAAQDNGPSSADATQPEGEIVVTGTRAAGRSRLDTASPVDVLSGNSLRRQGTTELAQSLANIAPSVDFPRASATDATDAIRPATLRGLPPNETLVLINNVRAHPSASININSTVGRGSAAVDLNTVPTAALDRIEVLRDGASAQYGSDAIAGVINLRLREARSGGGASVTYGIYDTDVNTARGSRHVTGEPTTTVSAWQGIGFGNDGYLTLSGEYQHRQPTNRADYPAANAIRPAGGPALQGRYGDPYVNQYTLFANAGTSLGEDWKLYGWGGWQQRHTSSAAFPRPNSAASVASATIAGYPQGFIPLIDTKSYDINSALGIKGELAGWAVDLSASYGRNVVQFRTENSANYGLGASTPHSFRDGSMAYDQWVGDLDVTRTFDVFQSLNVAFGLEGRREGYAIRPGELASYTASGAQGFPGFSPLNAVKAHRQNGSAYLDLEAQVTDKFLLGLAGRGETYSDFGEVATGKVSARYDFSRAFALRGTVSTGFRAPSLQEQYFTSISTVVQTNGDQLQSGTFPSTSAIASRLGGVPLRPEKSTNYSAGTVVRLGGFDLTVDGYLIRLRDQLALSENISPTTAGQSATLNAEIAAALAGTNATAARFFLNGVRSEVRGIDAVAHYRLRSANVGTFDLTLAGNVNKVEIKRVPTNTAVFTNDAPILFGRQRIVSITNGTPGEKVTGTIDWSAGSLGATLRATYYGDVIQPGSGTTAAVGAPGDIHSGRHTITDLELRYTADRGPEFAIGAQNLFDIYPKRVPANLNAASGVLGFPYYSPFGFGGRYLYVRAGLSW